jgi:hypothetical protein
LVSRGPAVTVLLAVALLALAGCSDGDEQVAEGVVIEVQGDLTSVTTFTVRTDDGDVLVFRPAASATFHGGPLPHIRDHLTSGLPVVVFYEETDGGLVALSVEDR